ncbi:3-dehydrosphinganine reductase TSC10A-like [Wolffia australiana]
MAKALLMAALLLPAAAAFLRSRRDGARVPIIGRHVFISGGSSGIGLAIAKLAAAAGAAKISLLARDAAKLSAARAEILRESKGGVHVAVFSADVRDEGAVRRAVEEAGEIDVLVCNQGVFLPCELEKQAMEEIKFTMDVNVMGCFHLIRAALAGMKSGASEEKPRSIAIVSSQAGQIGVYGYTSYSASKFALRGLAEALHQELIGHNVYISLVFPPDTDTPGLSEELKRRPEMTSVVAGTSSCMTAEGVAKKTLAGIMAARFMVYCNFDGLMMGIATAGVSPQRSWAMALAEIFGSGFMRFIALCTQYYWSKAIAKGHQAKDKRM